MADQQPLPQSIWEYIQNLQPSYNYAIRLDAAEHLGKLDVSYPAVVRALLAVKNSDPSEDVRKAAAAAILSAANQEVIKRYPDLPATFPDIFNIPKIQDRQSLVREIQTGIPPSGNSPGISTRITRTAVETSFDKPKARGLRVAIPCALAVLLLLFSPWVSCSGVNFSGIDLAQEKSINGGFIWLIPFAMVIVLIVIYSTLKDLTFDRLRTASRVDLIAAVGCLLVLIYVYLKTTEGYSRRFITIEFGGFGTLIALIGIIICSLYDLNEPHRT